MFAVPGWAVSAESLVSTNPDGILSASSQTDRAPLNSTSNSKKRRRDDHGSSDSHVTSEHLHKLWSKEFGGASEAKLRPPKARKKKRPQENNGAELRNGEHAIKNVDGENGENPYVRECLDSKDVLGGTTKQMAKNKRKDKRSENPASPRGRDDTQEKSKRNEKTELPQHPEHDKVRGRSEATLQNKKAQKALQKLQDLPPPTPRKLTPLQAKMRDKLTSARFRHLNETLYTTPSSVSLDLFTASPDLFAEYHAGFAQQVKDSWPENPVDGYIRDIKVRAKINFNMGKQDSTTNVISLPRRKTGSCTIADLGCGDAPLARALQSKTKALSLKFHSFDLHTPNSSVTKADIANLPLRDGEADIAVFCLSLMGTNWIGFIEEAWRVLRGDGKGELWVAEVKSRFGRVGRPNVVENSVGKRRKPQNPKAQQGKNGRPAEDDTEVFIEDEGTLAEDETDISAFTNVVQRRGFALRPGSVNKRNKMFVSMILIKTGMPSAGKHQGLMWNGHEYEKAASSTSSRKKFIDHKTGNDGDLSPEEEAKVLKPCVYKKR